MFEDDRLIGNLAANGELSYLLWRKSESWDLQQTLNLFALYAANAAFSDCITIIEVIRSGKHVPGVWVKLVWFCGSEL